MEQQGPDYAASVDFLRRWSPEQPWVITAIRVGGKGITTRSFAPVDGDQFQQWAQTLGVDHNLYFTPNPVRRPMAKKPERADIAAMVCVHVDLDPRVGEPLEEEQTRILLLLGNPPGLPKPTVVIFSGGGYQAFWRLREPRVLSGLDDAVDAARWNQGVELALGGDHCHNVDRLMRLPGTLNRPDQKKQKKGRRVMRATVIDYDHRRVVALDEFVPTPLVQGAADELGGVNGVVTPVGDLLSTRGADGVSPSAARKLAGVDELPDDVPDYCKIVIVQGTDPLDPGKFPSRSEALFYVCCELVRCDVDDATIFSVITDPEFLISTSVLEKGTSATRYAWKQIRTAREEAVHPRLREMNAKHAVVGDIGGTCRIVSEVFDPVLRRHRLSRTSFADFRNRYSHVQVAVERGGKLPGAIPLGSWWLGHPQRRQFESIIFAPGQEIPGTFNLWRGFGVTPKAGECAPFFEHIRNVVCAGKDEHYRYIVGWLADVVQTPARPGQVALVIKGKQGTGKGFFAREFGALFGRHFMHVTHASHLVGHFNAHLRDVVCLFADEAFYAGDQKHVPILKTLITEPTLMIEAKGVDSEVAPNCVHLLMASNERWAVPAGLDDRRFFVVEVSDEHRCDAGYFKQLGGYMANDGGREELLHVLLNYDLSKWHSGDRPDSAALVTEKMNTLDPELAWWYGKLRDGQLSSEDGEWVPVVLCDLLYADYVEANGRMGTKANPVRFGKFLATACPPVVRVRMSGEKVLHLPGGATKVLKRPWAYRFPDLDRCRTLWKDHFSMLEPWPDDDVRDVDSF